MALKPHFQSTTNLACQHIISGGVIAYPTETVFGLGCDPLQESALKKLLSIKQRNANKGLIIVAASLDQFQNLIQPLSQEQQQLIQTTTNPTTWLVPAKTDLSDLLCGEQRDNDKKIAIRVSSHPVIQAICNTLKFPITSTSANLSGQSTCRSSDEIRAQFKSSLDYIIDDQITENSKPSRIIDLISGKIIRE